MIMKKKFLTEMKIKLLAEKQDRQQKSSQKIEIDTDGDEVDEVQGNIQIELHNQVIGLNIAKINQIDEALVRIEKRTYGQCVDCSEPIPEKRLLANPYYLTCVSCAEDREFEARRARG
jgi:DnaK suppressor protein